jgi:hypothetical protein
MKNILCFFLVACALAGVACGGANVIVGDNDGGGDGSSRAEGGGRCAVEAGAPPNFACGQTQCNKETQYCYPAPNSLCHPLPCVCAVPGPPTCECVLANLTNFCGTGASAKCLLGSTGGISLSCM